MGGFCRGDRLILTALWIGYGAGIGFSIGSEDDDLWSDLREGGKICGDDIQSIARRGLGDRAVIVVKRS